MRGLRENLFEHYDFEALYSSIWMHLYSWYSADTQIARYLKVDSFAAADSQTLRQALNSGKVGNMELDLYPVKIQERIFQGLQYEPDDLTKNRSMDRLDESKKVKDVSSFIQPRASTNLGTYSV